MIVDIENQTGHPLTAMVRFETIDGKDATHGEWPGGQIGRVTFVLVDDPVFGRAKGERLVSWKEEGAA